MRVFLVAVLMMAAQSSSALTLREAVDLALKSDPRMTASGASVEASAAQVEEARAGFFPNLSFNADAGRSNFRINAPYPVSGQRNPTDIGVNFSQPLYSGGALSAARDAADSLLTGTRESARDVGGRVILATVTTYMDVLRDRGVLALSQANLGTLEKSRDDAQKRLDAGEATRTDVAQAGARVAEAQARLRRSLAQLRISEAAFTRVSSVRPDNLTSDWPVPVVPSTLDEAIKLSARAPAVLQAEAEAAASRSQIELAGAQRLPRLSLDSNAERSENTQFGYNTINTWAVQLKVTVPIYEGGLTRAKVSEAEARAQNAAAQAEDVRRRFAESATREWEQLQSAQEEIRAYESQVEASELALDGVRKELEAGTRTTLDLLDAERDLLSSQVNLVASRHDRAVTSFGLLAACGILFPESVP